MSSTEVEKYSSGYVFSQQAELDQLQDPENYMDDINTAKRINTQNIQTYQQIAEQPLSSNSREAWARRNQAKKAVKDAKKRTKEIKSAEKDLRTQINKRKEQLEKAKIQERVDYVEKVKQQEQNRKELEAKQQWLMTHKIGDIPKGIELGYLSEGSMSWYNRLKALEAPYANRRTDLPSHERNKLEFLYKGGTEKEWGDIREREARNRAASKRQSASIKGAAAIVESGGILGGKYTGTGYDEGTGQLTGDGSANNWGGYGSKEAQQRALQQELAKSFQAHPTYFNKSPITSGFSTGNQYFRDGKMIDPKSDEGKKLQQVLTTQAITKDVNEKQRKLFSDITKADSALEAWNIRSKAMTDDPRVGTFNYLMKDGKVIETSGTIGIATKTEYTREEGGLNKDSPLVFKSEYDPSVVPVDPGFKGIVDTTPQELSFVGYTPEGKPLQGAPKPEFTTYEMPEFLTLEDFARDYNFKENTLTSGTEDFLKGIDKKILELNPKKPEGDSMRFAVETTMSTGAMLGLGLVKEGASIGASIMNLATQHVNPFLRDSGFGGLVSSYNYKTGQWELPKDERPIQIPETALGKGIQQGLAGEDVLLGQKEYMGKYGLATFGEYATLYPGTGAVKPLLKLTGSGFKPVVAPLQTVSLTAAPLKGSIPIIKDGKVWAKVDKVQEAKVSDSITIFGKPVITKTLDQPSVVNLEKASDGTNIVNPLSTAGTWKLGGTKVEQVIQKADLEPFGSGLEVMTGSKMQTAFNREVVKELIKQGKMSKDALEEMDLIIEGVTIAAKPKPQILGSYGAKPFEFLDRGKETITMFEGLRKLQTSGHLKEARIGEIGGSTAMDVQLLPQYAKSPLGKLHDVDVSMAKYPDERSELAAKYLGGQMAKGTGTELKGLPSDMFVYHGTDVASAEKIMKGGFDFTKSKTSKGTIFAGSEVGASYIQKPVLLRVQLKDNLKVLDVNKLSDEAWDLIKKSPLGEDDAIRELAKKRGADIIENIMQGGMAKGREIEIVSNKAIKEIGWVSEGDKAWKSAIKQRGSVDLSGHWQNRVYPLVSGKGKKWVNEIKEGEFSLSGTKVKKRVGGKDEIVAEFLTKKDVNLGNLEAQTSGMRFGKKYKADTLFGFARKKVVEPTRGIEVQDLRDQLLSKASSAMSIQGSKSTKWKGDAAGDILETLSETKYTINPPAHRSKDIIDIYKIWKTQAYKLGLESDEGKRLDEIAELYRAKKEAQYGKLDFTMPSKPTMEFSIPSSNTFSSAVSSAGSQSVQLIKPSVLPGTKLTSSEQDQMLSSSTTSKVKSPSITSAISKSVIRSPAVMSATVSSATRSATSKIGSRSARSSTSLTSKTSRTSPTSPTSPTSLTSVSSPTSSTSFTSFTVRLSPSRSSGLRSSLVESKPTSGTGREVKGGMAIINWGSRTEEPKPTKKKPLKDFLGNVSESSILGVYKRKELTYGKKRVLKLSAKDKKLQASAKNRLQLLKSSDLKIKKKTKKKTETILGYTWKKEKKKKTKGLVF